MCLDCGWVVVGLVGDYDLFDVDVDGGWCVL